MPRRDPLFASGLPGVLDLAGQPTKGHELCRRRTGSRTLRSAMVVAPPSAPLRSSEEVVPPAPPPYGGKGASATAATGRRRRSLTDSVRVDWTVPQHCRTCGQTMRPARAVAAEWPNTRIYSGEGRCSFCAKESRKPGPTVRELFEQGHPCIELAPMPSNRRTLPW